MENPVATAILYGVDDEGRPIHEIVPLDSEGRGQVQSTQSFTIVSLEAWEEAKRIAAERIYALATKE